MSTGGVQSGVEKLAQVVRRQGQEFERQDAVVEVLRLSSSDSLRMTTSFFGLAASGEIGARQDAALTPSAMVYVALEWGEAESRLIPVVPSRVDRWLHIVAV
jgi:hypothetical protein